MKKFKLKVFNIFLVFLLLFNYCENNSESGKTSDFNFPVIDNIDPYIYDNIKVTCNKYWDMDFMIDSTFEIIKDGDEYAIHCDGYLDGELYEFVIRVDENGEWINDGRSKIPDQ